MTWIVTWNGVDYDVDPTEFTGMELKLLKQRTGLTFNTLTASLLEYDGEAICGLFWVAARRADPELKYTEFEGPPLKLVMANLDGLNTALDELGKAMGMPDEIPETNGSESSPSTPDTPEPSTTS